jgi:hypothetical protein
MAQEKLKLLKLSKGDIVESTGESLSNVNKAIKLGHIATFVVGRRRFARPQAVADWVDFLEAQSDAGRPVKYQARAK